MNVCHAAPVFVARIIAISYPEAVKLPIRPDHGVKASFGRMLKDVD